MINLHSLIDRKCNTLRIGPVPYLFSLCKSNVILHNNAIHHMSAETLGTLGYVKKEQAYQFKHQDDQSLINVLKEIANNPEIVNVVCPFYWMSHNRFNGVISDDCLKKRTIHLLHTVSIPER